MLYGWNAAGQDGNKKMCRQKTGTVKNTGITK
jgi:hypothetical protein